MLRRKHFFTLALPTLLLVFSGCVTTPADDTTPGADTTATVRPHSFNTAKIVYDLQGSMTGTTTVVLSGDRGVHETHAKVTRTEPDGTTSTEQVDTLIIDEGPTIYKIDLNTKKGQKIKNEVYAELSGMTQNEEKLIYLARLATSSRDPQPDPIKTANYAGYECDLYATSNGGEVCLWSGIPLYSTLEVPSQNISNTMEAISVELNGDIPNSIFDVPSDIEFTDFTTATESNSE